MHQRSCKVIEGLARNIYSELEEDSKQNSVDQEPSDIISQSPTNYDNTCALTKGINSQNRH